MREFLIFSCLIYGFLLLGWGARKIQPAFQSHSRTISRWTVLLVETPTIVLIYWGIRSEQFLFHLRIPLIAVVVMSVSGIAGLFVARLYRQSRPFTGAFTVSSMFSNNGPTLGGFLCLLYLGSEALIISQIYTLMCIPYFFTVVFLTARVFSPGRRTNLWDAVKMNFRDPISLLPISATVLGLLLAFTGTKFPDFLDLPRRVLVFTAVILYSISFGLGMQIRLMARKITNYLGMLPIKFVIAPATGWLSSLLFGYSFATDPLAFKVILIQAAMPVAIWSVVACKLFNLDENLAVGLWIFTTVSVAGLLPLVDWISGL
jgi:predicted permease